EQCLDKLRPGPVMIEDAKIGWPAKLALGPDGLGNSPDHIAHIMSSSMEALIHHFKLVTEGFRAPEGQAYAAVESAKGELGCYAVSDGGTRPYRVHFRDPSFTHLQTVAAMCEGGTVADVVAAVASIDPVMGGVDRRTRTTPRPVRANRSGSPTRSQPVWNRTPRKSSPATRGPGRRCCPCCTWCSPRRVTSARPVCAFAPTSSTSPSPRSKGSRPSTPCTVAAPAVTTRWGCAPTPCAP